MNAALSILTSDDGSGVRLRGSEYRKSSFCCTGNCNSNATDAFHPFGYLKSGEFKRLLYATPSSLESQVEFPESIRLFKHLFAHDCLLKKNDAHKIFYIVRQNLSYLEFQHRMSKSNVQFIRSEICNFLDYVTQCLQRFGRIETLNRINSEEIIGHLGRLVRHSGRFNDLKDDDITNYFSANRNGDHSAYHHFLHLSLDVRWTYLLAAHLHEKDESERGVVPSPVDYDNVGPISFTRCLRDVILDLVALSLKRFNKLRACDYVQESPFPCNCVRELWVMIIRLTDFREDIGFGDSFWVNLRRLVFDSFLKEDSLQSSNTSSTETGDIVASNPIGFCWWLLTHLSALYRINSDGNYCGGFTTQMRSNYSELCNLLKLSLTPEVGESSLRNYLRCCTAMCGTWEPSTDCAFILWDHFYKRLGDPFMIPGQIDSLGSQSNSIGSWLDALKSRSNEDFDAHESSYQIFLAAFGPLIASCQKCGAEQELQRLICRILSRFCPEKIREMSPLALTRAMDLLLTLAFSANLEDMTQKMLDVICMIDFDTANAAQRQVVWKSLFVLTLLHVERSQDATSPVMKLAEDCEQLVKYPRADANFTSLICVYIEGTQEVFESSRDFSLNEYLLLVPDLGKLLRNPNAPEHFPMMSMLQSLLYKLQTLYNETSTNSQLFQYHGISEVIWTSFVPIIKEVAPKSSGSDGLADIASILVFLVQDLPPTSSLIAKENLSSLFKYFSTCAMTRPEFSCRFVSNMLSCDDTRTRLAVQVPDYQEYVIRVWILCAIQMNNDSVRELGRIISKLPEVLRIFEEAEIKVPSCGFSDGLAIELFKALDKLAVKKSADFRDLIALKSKVASYVSDMSRVASVVLKNSSCTDQFKNLYHVVGHFVKYCALCAYTKAKSDCEFSMLIAIMILPREIYDDGKEISTAVLASIQDSLHLFVSGLSRLEIRKDPFIARSLRDILIYYLPRFTQQTNSSLTVLIHPLIVCLREAIEAGPESSLKDLVEYSVEVVQSHYLITRPSSRTDSAQRYVALNFLRDLISRCCNVYRAKLSLKLLRPLLDIVLEVDTNTNVCGVVKELLQSLLKAANTHCDIDAKLLLKTIVNMFLCDHVGNQSEKTFRIMEMIAAQVPYMIADMLPDIATAVNRVQLAKGSGVDDTLRKYHERFARHVGKQFAPT